MDKQVDTTLQQIFGDAICQQVDGWVAKYPADQKQSAVIPALNLLQEANEGWLSKQVMKALADYLDMPEISVFEVATFYSMYELEAVGKHKFSICTNISCMLNGSEEIVEHFQKRLGIKLGQTTDDGKVTLREVECLGACCGAPMLQLGNDYHEKLTIDKVDQLLDGLE